MGKKRELIEKLEERNTHLATVLFLAFHTYGHLMDREHYNHVLETLAENTDDGFWDAMEECIDEVEADLESVLNAAEDQSVEDAIADYDTLEERDMDLEDFTDEEIEAAYERTLAAHRDDPEPVVEGANVGC